MFGMLIVCYLFLGGCGAGLLFVSSVTSLAFYGSGRRTAYSTLVFSSVKDRCVAMGFLLLLVASLCLVGDLGRPERIIYLVIRPRWSVITFGAYALAALIMACGVQTLVSIFGFSWARGGVRRGLEMACAGLAVPVMIYTGVFLQSMGSAVALWSTPLVPVLFLLSALSTGFAAFFVALALTDRVDGLEAILGGLHKAHAITLVAELIVLVLFMVAISTAPAAHDSLSLLLRGYLAPWFTVGVIVSGLVVPLAAELSHVLRPHRGGFPIGDALCLLGGFALRYCMVNAAVH